MYSHITVIFFFFSNNSQNIPPFPIVIDIHKIVAALQFRCCCSLQNFTDQSFWAFVDLAKQSFCMITCDWLNTYCSTLFLYVLRIFLKHIMISSLFAHQKKKKKKYLDLKTSFFMLLPHFSQMCILKSPFSILLLWSEYMKMLFFICMERRGENHLVKISYWFPIQVDLAQTNEHRWGHSGIPANISASHASSLS